jgi:hypothetical protein
MKTLIYTALILACTAGAALAQALFGEGKPGMTGAVVVGPSAPCPPGCLRCEPSWSAASNKCLVRDTRAQRPAARQTKR